MEDHFLILNEKICNILENYNNIQQHPTTSNNDDQDTSSTIETIEIIIEKNSNFVTLNQMSYTTTMKNLNTKM